MPRYSNEDGNILKQFGAAVKAGSFDTGEFFAAACAKSYGG